MRNFNLYLGEIKREIFGAGEVNKGKVGGGMEQRWIIELETSISSMLIQAQPDWLTDWMTQLNNK